LATGKAPSGIRGTVRRALIEMLRNSGRTSDKNIRKLASIIGIGPLKATLGSLH
jgi:hypothetical protein